MVKEHHASVSPSVTVKVNAAMQRQDEKMVPQPRKVLYLLVQQHYVQKEYSHFFGQSSEQHLELQRVGVARRLKMEA